MLFAYGQGAPCVSTRFVRAGIRVREDSALLTADGLRRLVVRANIRALKHWLVGAGAGLAALGMVVPLSSRIAPPLESEPVEQLPREFVPSERQPWRRAS